MRRVSIRKHTPQRTCVSCRTVKAKQELIRLVRVSDGSVVVDTGGRKAGRGAYLCRSQGCWGVGFKGSQLEYVLRTTLTQGNREQLIRHGKDLL
jgi:hypothetical protein